LADLRRLPRDIPKLTKGTAQETQARHGLGGTIANQFERLVTLLEAWLVQKFDAVVYGGKRTRHIVAKTSSQEFSEFQFGRLRHLVTPLEISSPYFTPTKCAAIPGTF